MYAPATGRIAEINEAIVDRYYQTRAIRRVGEAFEPEQLAMFSSLKRWAK